MSSSQAFVRTDPMATTRRPPGWDNSVCTAGRNSTRLSYMNCSDFRLPCPQPSFSIWNLLANKAMEHVQAIETIILIIPVQFLVEGPLCVSQAEVRQSGTDAKPKGPSSLWPLEETKIIIKPKFFTVKGRFYRDKKKKKKNHHLVCIHPYSILNTRPAIMLAKLSSRQLNYNHILVLQHGGWLILTAGYVLAQKCHICLTKLLIEVRYDVKHVFKLHSDENKY